MKIRLPKTLAEPWTIPWFLPVVHGEDLVESIRDAVRDFFLRMDKMGHTPKATRSNFRMTVEDFLHILEHIAEVHGGIKVYGFMDKCMNNTNRPPLHIGNAYYIYFQVPNDPQLYNKCMISWFVKR